MISVSDLIGKEIVRPRRERRITPLTHGKRKRTAFELDVAARAHAVIVSGAFNEWRVKTGQASDINNSTDDNAPKNRKRQTKKLGIDLRSICDTTARRDGEPLCSICHAPFAPYHSKQLTCGSDACKAAQERRSAREYKRRLREARSCGR